MTENKELRQRPQGVKFIKNMIPKNGDNGNAETSAINKRGRANEIVQKFRSRNSDPVIAIWFRSVCIFVC